MPKQGQKLNIWVITLLPDIFENHLKHLPISRAMSKNLLEINFINLRDFALDKRGTVDSPPYGGGPGMVLRPEPIYDSIMHVLNKISEQKGKTKLIFLTPRGKVYNQKIAWKLSKDYNHLIIVCGRYEGIDQRVIDYFGQKFKKSRNLHPQEISIGKYVLSGGEVAAMAIIESVVRLLPGAIDNQEALINESFNPSNPKKVEHPQYSRPKIWFNMQVPQVLLSGNHKKIAQWKLSTQ